MPSSSVTIKLPARVPKPTTYKNDAERRRADALYSDPLVVVLDPANVQCKMCTARIKLSRQITFEPSHWRTHRARCQKKQAAHKTRPLKDAPSTSQRSSKSPSKSATPSLVSDDEADSMSFEIETPPRLSSPPPPPKIKALVCLPEVQEYLEQNHGTSAYPAIQDTWQSWNWSRIQPAKFARLRSKHAGQNLDLEDDDFDY